MGKWPHHMDNSTCDRASPRGIHGFPECHSHLHFRLSMARVIMLNHELIHLSIVVDGIRQNAVQRGLPLGVLPQKLQSHEAAGRYINAFRAPFQELTLSRQEVYVLRACSLLVIPPPPPGRMAPQGDFQIDLVKINLSGWASLVQDVAASLQVLPPSLSNCLDPEMLNLLHQLEAVTQVKFCCLYCY